jgi:phage repressor protein C with HTH and peptisase S24 domain
MVGISSRVGTFHEKEETATTGGVTSEVVMSEEATNAIAEVTNAMVEVTVATTLTAGSTEEETGTAIVVLTATTGPAASGTAGTGGRGILPAGSVNQSEDVVEMPPAPSAVEVREKARRAES